MSTKDGKYYVSYYDPQFEKDKEKQKMSDKDNVKWIDIGEKMVKQMLEQKQKEYGSFDNNAFIIANFIQSMRSCKWI